MEPLDPLPTLAKFTPTSSLNRDTLMFAAGKAAGQPRWPWKTLVLVLACSQLGTLFWYNRPASTPAPGSTGPVMNVSDPITETPPANRYTPEQNSILWLQQRPTPPAHTAPSLEPQVIARQSPVLTAWAPALIP